MTDVFKAGKPRRAGRLRASKQGRAPTCSGRVEEDTDLAKAKRLVEGRRQVLVAQNATTAASIATAAQEKEIAEAATAAAVAQARARMRSLARVIVEHSAAADQELAKIDYQC